MGCVRSDVGQEVESCHWKEPSVSRIHFDMWSPIFSEYRANHSHLFSQNRAFLFVCLFVSFILTNKDPENCHPMWAATGGFHSGISQEAPQTHAHAGT